MFLKEIDHFFEHLHIIFLEMQHFGFRPIKQLKNVFIHQFSYVFYRFPIQNFQVRCLFIFGFLLLSPIFLFTNNEHR